MVWLMIWEYESSWKICYCKSKLSTTIKKLKQRANVFFLWGTYRDRRYNVLVFLEMLFILGFCGKLVYFFLLAVYLLYLGYVVYVSYGKGEVSIGLI